MAEIVLPELMVPKFYTMDPATEDLLPDAEYLVDGLVVLSGEPSDRVDLANRTDEWMTDRAYERNRWARVSHVVRIRDGRRDEVAFVATYADGTKRKRRVLPKSAWLVKKDSIQTGLLRMDVGGDTKLKRIQWVIEEAMREQDAATRHGQSSRVKGVAESGARKILEILGEK